MMKSWRSSPYAIKDVDEDEEECDEHCHPESESETSASCINVQKKYCGRLPMKELCPLPSKWNFWINAAVIWEFLDQCRWCLGKAFSLFGWLCFDRYWQQNWKPTTEPSFILEKTLEKSQKGYEALKQGLRLQAWQGICFIYFPLGRGNCCYRHALVCNGEGEQSGENNSVLGEKSSPAGDHLWFDHEADPADNDKHAAGQVDLEHGPAFGTGQRIVRRPGWHTASASSEGALGSHRLSSCLHEDRRWKGGWL